jgi:5-methylcytosine-specific restriction endonuclease McrBC regulatory subunit McrC
MKVKGKIDINRFIKYDIPFKGKVSSTSREQMEVQEIIDVLYKAITIIDKESKKNNAISTKNISNIKTHLKQYKSNKYVSNETIAKAIESKALQNPIFSPYIKVLEYAKLIINANNLEEKKDADKETFGFLVNVAELFEIYLVKLLQYKMPDWDVIHEEPLDVYQENFFRRNMYPDIVMKKDNKVMVFDAKYKRMLFRDRYRGADLDRNDFFQINTYMTYYDKQGYEVKAGGLLYPIESNIESIEQTADKKAHADNWFGNDKTQFIVDGIDLSKNDLTIEDILKSENAFIDRIQKISENTK